MEESQRTVEPSTDASSSSPKHWRAILWPYHERQARRLQIRIAKATQAGQHRKAQALQWILTHSLSAKLLAVRRVTSNKGAKTPGVDNVRWTTDKQKLNAAFSLKRRGYKALPLRRHYLVKPNGKLRPLGIPTLHDRAMQALHALALAPIAESLADRNSYGFRQGRCCADALGYTHTVLSRKNSAPWVLEGDIQACFDQISHDWLLRHVPMDKRILAQWLQAGYLEGTQLFPTQAGTPQGGIISPLLANLALDGLEAAVKALAAKDDKVFFVRYADDFVVTGATRELLEQKIKPAVTAFLHERGLQLSEQKTVITHINDGFDFLGHTVRKFGDKLLIQPAQSKLKALRQKISERIQTALAHTQAQLIRQLNPLLRGWANYFRNAAAKRTFQRVDYHLFRQLWRWARRRHPNQSRRWLKQKYFSAAGDKWAFSLRTRTAEGESRVLKLYRVARTQIERHIKVRSAANPYDPRYTEYFQKRRCFAWRILGGPSLALPSKALP